MSKLVLASICVGLFSCAAHQAEYYIDQLADPRRQVRLDASYALVQLGGVAVEPLISCATTGRDSLRYIAVQILGQIGDPRATPFLKELLSDDNRYVREQAVRALGQLDNPGLHAALASVLAADSVAEVRGAAAWSLGNLRDTTAVPSLVRALADTVPSVRRQALAALQFLWTPAAEAAALAALRGPLENPALPKIAHNAVYDQMILQRYGITVAPIEFDTMLAEWLHNPSSKFLGLKALVGQRLDLRMTDISELLGKGKKQLTMDKVEIEAAARYAAADAAMTWRLVAPLGEELQRDSLEKIYTSLELPLIPIISRMQQNGVCLDVPYLRAMSQGLGDRLTALEAAIYDDGGIGRFNINSPKQLNTVLFEVLKLPVAGLKKIKLGYSTDVNTLEILKEAHPIIRRIVDYRELAKLKNTYVDALPELVNETTGRLHTSYNQAGSATGRFSSSQPNLQNIPNRTELGREVRRAFVAPPGYVLLAVDYNQIELRVMAHISQDATLIAAFHRGLDIHRATAAAVAGIEPTEVTYEQRSFAKQVNFGLMYGMGAFRLARDSDLTLAEAERFISAYFERMPGVERYIQDTKDYVWQHGYTKTLYGRRRIYPAIMANGNRRSTAAEERAAINMPIQGTAADILKQSMINLQGRLAAAAYDAKLILQVHDELVLEVKEEQLPEVSKLVVATMEAALPDEQPLRVPLKANASYGRNWRDMTELD